MRELKYKTYNSSWMSFNESVRYLYVHICNMDIYLIDM